MDNETAMALARYLVYLLDCPTTRKNEALIDCCIELMNHKPDTELSLAESMKEGD